MSRDYAKKRHSGGQGGNSKKSTRAATRNQPGEEGHWSWFLSGLFSGVLLCVIGYIAILTLDNGSALTDQASVGESTAGDDESGPDLDFYDYLPQAEVEVNVVPVDVAESAAEEADPVTYYLQAASFQNPDDADEMRARLILLNLETRIVPTPISGRTWYRVQAGPFVGRRSVEAAEETLFENNIEPIRLRVPSLQ